MILARLRRRNPPIEGVFINPGEKKMRKRRSSNPPRRAMAIYIRPPKPRRKKNENPSKRRRKKNENPVYSYAKRRRKTNENPSKRRRRSNPAVLSRSYYQNPPRRRRKNPDGLGRFTDMVKPTLIAAGGYMLPGLIWKILGSKNRASMIGWFKENGDAKARMTVAAGSTVLLYLLSGWFPTLGRYQKSLMIGSGLRLAVETSDALLSMKPGSTSETIRMVMGLPTVATLGRAYLGQQWPQGQPLPPGTKRNPQTGILEPAAYEPDEYPTADQAAYAGGQQYDAATAAYLAAIQAQQQQSSAGGQLPPQEGGIFGFMQRQVAPGAMAGFMQRQVAPGAMAGFAQRNIVMQQGKYPTMSGVFPRPF